MGIRLDKTSVQSLIANGAILGPSVNLPGVAEQAKPSKYGNSKKDEFGNSDGFDSRKEARIYADLCLCERAGIVRNLRRQVPFDLVVNGKKVCRYVADMVFERLHENGWKEIVADVKSEATRKNRAYRIKAKLFEAIHGFGVTEL